MDNKSHPVRHYRLEDAVANELTRIKKYSWNATFKKLLKIEGGEDESDSNWSKNNAK